MRIIQLPEANSIQSTDVFAININGRDYKVPVSLLVSAMQTIGSYLTSGDVANNLTTVAAGKVLDARQGAALNALITAVQTALSLSIMVGSTTTIAAGTSTVSLTGLTADHRVAYWGFSSGGENDPPADITVTTAAGSYTVAVSNVASSGVTMTPVFIKPQN